MRAYTLFVVHQMIWLWLAIPTIAQESQVQVIPPACSSVTVPATPTAAGKNTVTCPKLTITTPVALPQATQSKAYAANLAALANPKGGWCPNGFNNCYAYTLNSGPTWMKLSASGVVTGTPTATGSVPFTFTVTDQGPSLTSQGQGSVDVAKHPHQSHSGH